ncbi:hypothetical protein PDJAM_G00012210 [Pangasius djambal]|uniref:Uncharacterized protein n=1 Tax=Pangasius djambal TaxID=1691987 RepID=A0ACC5Y078_9TELE|nr:hypothetical protein [Pangasius djambal]
MTSKMSVSGEQDTKNDERSQIRTKKSKRICTDELETVFMDLEHKVITLIKNELKRFKKLLSPDYPACSEREVEDEEDLHSVTEGALKITLHVLKIMNHTDLANTLQNKLTSGNEKLKSNLRKKYKRINEGIPQHGSSALLNEIYTDLYITESGSGDINNEHEALITDPLPEVLLFLRITEASYLCYLVYTLRRDLIGCSWSRGYPEESRGKQIPLDEVCQQHIH